MRPMSLRLALVRAGLRYAGTNCLLRRAITDAADAPTRLTQPCPPPPQEPQGLVGLTWQSDIRRTAPKEEGTPQVTAPSGKTPYANQAEVSPNRSLKRLPPLG